MTSAPHPLIKMDSHYEARVSSEIDIYRDCLDVHNLPAIFHYWSACHISPMLEPHGFSNPRGMFLMALENQCIRHDGGRVSFLSLGAGNCDLEISLAAELRQRGCRDFTIECIDLNPAMLQRGARNAAARGVGKIWNSWRPI